MINVDELMEQARREGLVTAQEEARLKKESIQAAAEIADDLKGRHPLQGALYFNDMTDEGVIKVMDNLEPRVLRLYLGYLEPKYFERAKKLADSSIRQKFLRSYFEALDNLSTEGDNEPDESTSN